MVSIVKFTLAGLKLRVGGCATGGTVPIEELARLVFLKMQRNFVIGLACCFLCGVQPPLERYCYDHIALILQP
jgi:hypothetical protein